MNGETKPTRSENVLLNGSAVRLRPYLLLALGMLALGLAVDLLLTQPAAREVARLRAELSAVTVEAMDQAQHARDAAALTRHLGMDDPASLLGGDADPLTYLAATARQAGLATEELAVSETQRRLGLIQTRVEMRVQGDFDELLDFMRLLESGQRVVAIEELSIEVHAEPPRLAGRFSVCDYQPHRS